MTISCAACSPGAYEELNPRPSLTSPFEASAPAQHSSHAANEPSGYPAAAHAPVLAAAAMPSQDFVRSPFDSSGQLEAALPSGAQQQVSSTSGPASLMLMHGQGMA